jgi:hypothetical protein
MSPQRWLYRFGQQGRVVIVSLARPAKQDVAVKNHILHPQLQKFHEP